MSSNPPGKPAPAAPKIARLKTIKSNTPGDASGGGVGVARPTVTASRPTTVTTTTTTTTATGTTPNTITPNISKAKKEFRPNIVNRKKPNEKGGDPLSTGAISDLMGSSLSPLSSIGDKPGKPSSLSGGKFRPNLNPNRKKPAATPITNLFHTPLIQAETQQQQSSYEMNKKNEKKDSDLLAQLFHEMEVDPMQPFHPTHLPLVDPRKIMKAYSLDDASKDIDEKKRELELKIANGELSDTTNFTLQGDNLLDSAGNAAKKNKEVSTRDRPFYVEDQFLNKDKLFFIQLPNSLPTTVSKPNFNIPNPVLPTPKPPAQQPSTTAAATTTTDTPTNVDEPPPKVELNEKSFVPMIYPGDFPPSLKAISPGKLGTLKIYKSGKTILKIGTVEYDISSGDKLKFLEEVMCFQTQGGPENQPTCYTLGIPSQHLVAAPIISQISGI